MDNLSKLQRNTRIIRVENNPCNFPHVSLFDRGIYGFFNGNFFMNIKKSLLILRRVPAYIKFASRVGHGLPPGAWSPRSLSTLEFST